MGNWEFIEGPRTCEVPAYNHIERIILAESQQRSYITLRKRHSQAEHKVMRSIALEPRKVIMDKHGAKMRVGKMCYDDLVCAIVHVSKPS